MSTIIEPGATIGILGGGQLGRMMAISARSLGYRVRVMDPDPLCPASKVVDACVVGDWDDTEAASLLAKQSDVVTLEIEQIASESLAAAARYAPLRPTVQSVYIIQDRIRQKNWLLDKGFPVGKYHVIKPAIDVDMQRLKASPDLFLKRSQGGYDGKSQIHVQNATPVSLQAAWNKLGAAECIAEEASDLEMEISVAVARSPRGEIKVYPAACNYHEKQILVWSVLPASLPWSMEIRAQQIAIGIAEEMGYEGLLTVELFITKQGVLLVNELAPRPHNSYHSSERACSTNQFEQAIRAICNLPLGDVAVVQPTAIANLLGELWENGAPKFERALALPGVRLHLYEKHSVRKGRKMGHLSATGKTPEEAVARVKDAWHALSVNSEANTV